MLSPARRKASGGRAQALNVSSVLLANDLLDLGHASVTPREAPGGPWAASGGSCGPPRWSRVTLGSAGASGTCCVASHGRRHTHIAPSAHRKKNACNGRIYGRLSGRDYDISRFKSSFIPPVRSPEACRGVRLQIDGQYERSVCPIRYHFVTRDYRVRYIGIYWVRLVM